MSGQPLRNPNDASKFRKAYMATLQLQQELNKKNFDANALYKRTGVVPTQITDYRSTSEKLADLINLRIMIRSQLRQIADAQNAEDIAQSLTADQLVFLSQQTDAILKELKPKYKFGILKDIFMKYLDNYMMKEQSNQLASVGLPDTNRPDRTAPRVLLPYQQKSQDIYTEIENALSATSGTEPLIQRIKEGLELLRYVDKEVEKIKQDKQGIDAIDESEIDDLLDVIESTIPRYEDLRLLRDKLEDREGDAYVGALEELIDLIEPRTVENGQPLTYFNIQRARQILDKTSSASLDLPIAESAEDDSDLTTIPTSASEKIILEPLTRMDANDPRAEARVKSKLLSYGVKGKPTQQLAEILTPYYQLGVLPYKTGQKLSLAKMKSDIQEYWTRMWRAYTEQQAELRGSKEPAGDGGAGGGGDYETGGDAPRSRRTADVGERKSFVSVSKTPKPGPPPAFETGLKGRGIAKGVDYEKGIEPLPKYAPVGNYYINLQKLKDDIITCCRPDGRNANDWKARRVSLPLANVIRKLVNKGKPTFDEMSELNDEDRHTLGDFIRKAKLDIDIPNSKIDREDLNKFEIMKGQIMSGQDNKDYIKEFKLLIVKLAHQGRLPKGQAKEVLMDLASLGY